MKMVDAKDTPKIFVVIPNLNGEEHLIKCLGSIRSQKKFVTDIVIVDNGSTDKSVEIVKKKFPEAHVLLMKKNLGYAEGSNIGVKFSLKNNAEYILILNNDTILCRNFFFNLINTMQSDKRIGIIGPKICFFENRKKLWFAGGVIDSKRFTAGHKTYKKNSKADAKPKKTDFVTGCAMFVRSSLFKEIGFFDKRFFIYYEDVDFCLRAKKNGYKIIYEPRSLLYHKAPYQERVSDFMDYLMARNHFLLLEKHGSFQIKMREYLRLPWTIIEHLRKNEKSRISGIRDYFLKRFEYNDYRS